MDKSKWEYKKLGELGNIITGGTPPTKDARNYSSDDYCFVKPSDLTDDRVLFLDDSEFHVSSYAYSNSRKLPKGSVLVCCIGSIGKLGILNMDATCNQQINAIIPNSEIDSKYIAYSLLASKGRLLGIANAPVVPIINKSQFSNFEIKICPFIDQQRIVAELDCLNEMIAVKQEQLKEFDKLAQSIFYDMFGDPVLNEKKWEITKFEDVCDSMTKGPFGSDIKKSLYVPKSESAYKVYIQVNAIEKNVTLGDYYISKSYFEDKMFRFEVKPNDYIITCDGTLGKYVRLPHNIEKGIISASLLKLTLNDNINFKYFEYIWDCYVLGLLIKDIRNTALKHLPSASKIGKVYIPLPPLALQQQFADKISAIEAQKELVKQSIAETQHILDYTMDKYFG